MRLLVFGLGYSASALAGRMRDRASWIGGTTRSPAKAAGFAAKGIEPFVFDGTSQGEGIAAGLREATHLLVSIPPGAAGDPVLDRYAAEIATARQLRWIGYLSTVGVYGDQGGGWVDEAMPPRPRPGRATERVAAEGAWTDLARRSGVPLGIFRIAGIYGPGRNALVNLAEGRAHRIVKPGQLFNRIHLADIAGTLVSALERTAAGIFNLADDEPAPPQDVVSFAAELMGVPPPPEIPFAEADLSPMARSFYADNRRVSNRRIKEELGVTLRYPTYRDALTSMWQDGTWNALPEGP